MYLFTAHIIMDTGTTGHYLTLNLPCDNKQQAVHPLTIQITNDKIIMSTHTALLSHQDLMIQEQRSHIFLGLNKALLSIGTLYNQGYEAIVNDNSVSILNKWSGNIIMEGTRYPRTNLYMLNLTHPNKLMTESTTPEEYFVGSA